MGISWSRDPQGFQHTSPQQGRRHSHIAPKEEIQRKIERLLELGTEDFMDVDQYLVEVNTNDLESGSGECQEYWLLVICAARKAGLLWRQQQLNPCGWTPLESGYVH
jgi:hypothetical protein